MAFAMNRDISINNFPTVRREYCLTHYYADFTEDIKYKKFFNKPFYKLDRNDLVTNALFLPQNHQCFRHWNLHCETYFRIGHVKGNSGSTEELLCKEFMKEAKEVIKREILQQMSETYSPELTGRLTRSLISYGRIANCIDWAERIALTRFCLATLFIKARDDYGAVVEVLTNLRCASRVYVQELYDHYTDTLTRYIFESCIKARFNFRDFILRHPSNSAAANPVCPILENLLDGDYTFLRLFLEFGFERYQEKNIRSLRYEFLRVSQRLSLHQVEIPRVLGDADAEHLKRYNLILQTASCVCASLSEFDQRPWGDIASLIWKSIPDPRLTVSDVITMVAGGADQGKVETITARCNTETFTEIFRDAPQPRRLKHLCRCAIREAIGQNFLLPLGINQLGLPPKVVEYLDILVSEDDH